jgi:hypothetical protein
VQWKCWGIVTCGSEQEILVYSYLFPLNAHGDTSSNYNLINREWENLKININNFGQ